MAYGTLAATSDATKLFGVDVIAGSVFGRTKVAFGVEGAATDVSATAPLPVTIISGGGGVGLTDTQLRASPVPVTGTVSVTGAFFQATQPVSLAALPSLVAGTALIGKVGVQVAGADVSAANPLPTQPVTATAALVDRSGTITTGGTAQNIMAANSSRRGAWFQNNSDADMRINATGAASASSGLVLPASKNAYFDFQSGGVPVTAISVWCGTTGKAFEAREW